MCLRVRLSPRVLESEAESRIDCLVDDLLCSYLYP